MYQETISNKSSFDRLMAWLQDITLAIYYVDFATINSRPIYLMKTFLLFHLTPLHMIVSYYSIGLNNSKIIVAE